MSKTHSSDLCSVLPISVRRKDPYSTKYTLEYSFCRHGGPVCGRFVLCFADFYVTNFMLLFKKSTVHFADVDVLTWLQCTDDLCSVVQIFCVKILMPLFNKSNTFPVHFADVEEIVQVLCTKCLKWRRMPAGIPFLDPQFEGDW